MFPLTNRDQERAFGQLKHTAARYLRMTRNNLGSITLAKLNKLPLWLTTISIKDFGEIVLKIQLTKKEESRKRKSVTAQNVDPKLPKV